VEMGKSGFMIPGRQRYLPQSYKVPGDYSSASFPLVAGALTGGVSIAGLDPEDKQGDKLILDILERFGAVVKRGSTGVKVLPGKLEGITVDLSDAPDLFPLVAVLASQAKGVTEIINAEHVRLKESDRIKSTVAFLRAMGVNLQERSDGCLVKGPSRLKGAEVDSLEDHRILMAAAVAGLVAEGETVISHGDCYRISYPNFVDDMVGSGADMEMII